MIQLPVPLVTVTKGSNLCQLAAALMVRAYYGERVDTKEAEEEIRAFLPFTLGNNEHHSQGMALWLALKGYDVSFTHHALNVVTSRDPKITPENLKAWHEAALQHGHSFQSKKLGLDIQLLENGVRLSHTLPGPEMLDAHLAQKIPVICIVKDSSLRPGPQNTTNHAIVIIGKRGHDYIYNDCLCDEPQQIPQNNLLQAWYSCGAYTIVATRQCAGN